MRDHQMRALRKPSRKLHMSVFNYIYNRQLVTKKDMRFVYHRDDFVMLTDHVEFNWLDDLMHKFMDYDASGLLRVSNALLFTSPSSYFLLRFYSSSSFSKQAPDFRILIKPLSSTSAPPKKTATAQPTRSSITTHAPVSAPSSAPSQPSSQPRYFWFPSTFSLPFP